ncbi:MAG TPA: hypothetical protein VI893_06475 [Thermoplasmata archaeon]|nr:hypothetical protein [Thermoplasmata archaeon]
MAPPWLTLSLGFLQQMGLSFLLGGFVIAALSDLKYMGAQKEFGQVWVVSILGFLALDAWLNFLVDPTSFAVKLLLIVVFAAVSNNRTGWFFSLAIGDIMAVAAVLAVLPWVYGVIFLIFLKVLDLLMRPLLRVAGRGDAYPFMPVIVVAAVAVLAFAYLIAPAIPL